MPFPVAAAIAAGSAIAGTGINAMAQGKMNKKTRQWNEKMYGIQRTDALADYNSQNEYNSPSAVMARLRKAGLNPALAYENGGASVTAAPIRSTEAKQWTPHAPQIDPNFLGPAVNTYYDTKVKEATTDNLLKQNTVLENEARLKSAQVIQTLASTDLTNQQAGRSKFDLALASSLRQNSLDIADANLSKVKADITFTSDSNVRAAAQNSATLKQAAATLLKTAAETSNTKLTGDKLHEEIKKLKNDQTLQDLDIQMRKDGLNPSDPFYLRALQKWWNSTEPTDWRGVGEKLYQKLPNLTGPITRKQKLQ